MRLYQGNTSGAAADAALVPKGFVFNASTDASDGGGRRANRVYAAVQQTGNYTVESVSINLKTENGEVDPRSATVTTNTRPADSQVGDLRADQVFVGRRRRTTRSAMRFRCRSRATRKRS